LPVGVDAGDAADVHPDHPDVVADVEAGGGGEVGSHPVVAKVLYGKVTRADERGDERERRDREDRLPPAGWGGHLISGSGRGAGGNPSPALSNGWVNCPGSRFWMYE